MGSVIAIGRVGDRASKEPKWLWLEIALCSALAELGHQAVPR